MRRVLHILIAATVGVSLVDAAMPTPRFRAVTVDAQVGIGYGVTLADIDGDKRPDIVLADKSQFVWYRNPTWEKHVLAEHVTALDNVCLAAADVDGDGKAELAVGAGWNPSDTVNSGAVFYLVPPADRLGRWEPVTLPHEPTVHRMRWVRNRGGKLDLVVVPLHGRGNVNGQGAGVRIMAYHIPNDPRQSWSTELIDSSLHATHNFNPVQWYPGPAQQMLVAAKEGIFLFRPGVTGWEREQLAGPESGAMAGAGEIRDGKLPGGRRFLVTVEPMHGNQLVAYVQSPSPAPSESMWHRHVLDDSLREGHALACADLLGIGSDQVLVGWRGRDRTGKVGIKMFIPMDAAGKEWSQHWVDENTMACEDLCVGDLDGDGRPDIIAAGRATKNLKIYLNQTPKE